MIKTVSLETSKLLKEAGFKQNLWFRWESTQDKKAKLCFKGDGPSSRYNFITTFASPLVSELLEELPTYTKMMVETTGVYQALYAYGSGSGQIHYETENNLAEALAKLWLWLKKRKII